MAACRIERLQLGYDASNRWWQRVRQLAQRDVERWGGQVPIGFTDLRENLDIVSAKGARIIVRKPGGRSFGLHSQEAMGPSEAEDFLALPATEGAPG